MVKIILAGFYLICLGLELVFAFSLIFSLVCLRGF